MRTKISSAAQPRECWHKFSTKRICAPRVGTSRSPFVLSPKCQYGMRMPRRVGSEGARLPVGLSWPEINSPTQLLAQINCNHLPDDLWQGLGPREGWLAIFLDPKSFKLTALHFDQAGPFVSSPEVDKECYILGIDHRRRTPNRTWQFTRWPVDIVPV